jgi:RNA polymerase sigma-70 factor (ECF subfamily)
MTDAGEFEAFVRRYADMVYATAVRLLTSRTEAEDVVQTVFLKAFERYTQLSAGPSAGGWLKTVTTNLCLNHLSRHRRRVWLFSELAAETESENDALDRLATVPPLDVERVEDVERLERALAALPPHQRVPLVLFHIEGQSHRQIAPALGISVAKLKTDLHRGRQALRRHLTRADGSR